MSLFAGFFCPGFYTLFLGVLTYFASWFFTIFGRQNAFHAWVDSAQSVLLLPVSGPSYIYFYFYPPDADVPMFTGFELGNIVSLLVGNFVFYSLLSYAFLTIYRSKIEKPFPPLTLN